MACLIVEQTAVTSDEPPEAEANWRDPHTKNLLFPPCSLPSFAYERLPFKGHCPQKSRFDVGVCYRWVIPFNVGEFGVRHRLSAIVDLTRQRGIYAKTAIAANLQSPDPGAANINHGLTTTFSRNVTLIQDERSVVTETPFPPCGTGQLPGCVVGMESKQSKTLSASTSSTSKAQLHQFSLELRGRNAFRATSSRSHELVSPEKAAAKNPSMKYLATRIMPQASIIKGPKLVSCCFG
ncbi:hypothetical protein CC78DRAFT_575509 [Lojkania enalia]|uniref:Uncharacterized protein n=1 Tax=Lojkania enalia TaxID=147567 RepID=A0A9P4N7E2_9PLEO|nr:hypothetical protein CC78DRAFT_575509 [Didymosphaeria enalia]